MIYRPSNLNYDPEWSIYHPGEDNPELQLYASYIVEATDIAGFVIEYYIAISNLDYLYGEDSNQSFLQPATTRLMYEPSNDDHILNIFGLSEENSIQYTVIPKYTFTRDVSGTFAEISIDDVDEIQPKIGDVIKCLWDGNTYEICTVGDTGKVFSASKQTWELILKPYRFSVESPAAEEIHSGVSSEFFDISSFNNEDLPSGTSITINTSGGHEITGSDNPAPSGNNTSDNLMPIGENDWIEEESDKIDDYEDIDDFYFKDRE
jgi:hypothetical protein